MGAVVMNEGRTATTLPRVLMTTHRVVIDANDEEHARWLEEALRNDRYRVSREVCHMVQHLDGSVTMERERA